MRSSDIPFKYYLYESAIFGERECRQVGDSSAPA
jgi:hypothetical protein